MPRQLDENIWVLDGDPVQFFSFPYQIRMTVVRLSDGTLFLHSPIQCTPENRAAVEALGPVAHIVSPNLLHNLYLADWQTAYPEAKLHLPPGLAKRRPNLKPASTLGGEPDPAWAADIDQVLFQESFFTQEVVFFHRRSRSVILGDLIEHHDPHRLSLFQRVVARLNGMLGTTPVNYRLTFLRRSQAREAFLQMLAWEPTRVIVMHGRIEDEDAIKFLRDAFRWLNLEKRLQAAIG